MVKKIIFAAVITVLSVNLAYTTGKTIFPNRMQITNAQKPAPKKCTGDKNKKIKACPINQLTGKQNKEK